MAVRSKSEPADDAEPKAEPLVKVSPAANYQLSHEGVVVGPGESIRVPKSVAEAWRTRGLVE